MERSAEERTKYPDRINLDRRGLHGIPLLADEPGLRLLRLFFNHHPHPLQLPAQLHQEDSQPGNDQQAGVP